MTLLWVITGAALAVAVVAMSQARRTAKRLEQLTQLYWELKYQHGELRAQLRHDRPAGAGPDDGAAAGGGAARAVDSRSAPDKSFIPLTSLKR